MSAESEGTGLSGQAGLDLRMVVKILSSAEGAKRDRQEVLGPLNLEALRSQWPRAIQLCGFQIF